MTINNTSRVWDGIYGSFSEVATGRAVFEETIWLDKVVERARQAVLQSGGTSALAPVAVTSDYALPFVAALTARRDRLLRILDFGGGIGTSFLPFAKMLPPDQPIDFVIVEITITEVLTIKQNALPIQIN